MNWNLGMLIFAEGGKPENQEKNPWSKGDNTATHVYILWSKHDESCTELELLLWLLKHSTTSRIFILQYIDSHLKKYTFFLHYKWCERRYKRLTLWEYPLRSNWNLEILIFTEGGKPDDQENIPCGKGENIPCGKGENQQTTQLTWCTRAKDQTLNPLGPQQWEASVLRQHHPCTQIRVHIISWVFYIKLYRKSKNKYSFKLKIQEISLQRHLKASSCSTCHAIQGGGGGYVGENSCIPPWS
jgi:hypothetical protein